MGYSTCRGSKLEQASIFPPNLLANSLSPCSSPCFSLTGFQGMEKQSVLPRSHMPMHIFSPIIFISILWNVCTKPKGTTFHPLTPLSPPSGAMRLSFLFSFLLFLSSPLFFFSTKRHGCKESKPEGERHCLSLRAFLPSSELST